MSGDLETLCFTTLDKVSKSEPVKANKTRCFLFIQYYIAINQSFAATGSHDIVATEKKKYIF